MLTSITTKTLLAAALLLALPTVADAACSRTITPTQNIAANTISGGTLCLKPGTYRQQVTITKTGVTVTSSDPSNRALIVGRVYVHSGANGARFTQLRLDGNSSAAGGLPSPTVDANDVRFDHNDVSALNNIAFIVGSDQYGRADRFEGDHNRIHDVGVNSDRSGQGFYDHAFYVQAANGIRIHDNTMWRISGRCVQFYGQADSAVVSYNTCDDMGVGVIIDKRTTNLLVTRNIFTHATSLGAVARGSIFAGSGDRVSDNWFYANSRNYYDIPSSGITASGTHVGDPQYVAAGSRDYRLRSGSPAVGYGARP